jgi:hypothetical protein
MYRKIQRYMSIENSSIKNKKAEEPVTKKLLNKALSLFVLIRHGRVPLKYFYRHTYYCQLVQLKYLIKDYLTKKKYKTIAFSGEFAPELQFVLPFAYWHYKNGTLQKTRSSKYTAELYFFSPDHEEAFESRTPEGNYNFDIPRILYSHNYDMKKWLPVPLKEIYKNNFFVYEKPILIVANRYNKEWDGPPISYFSIEMLDFIFSTLQQCYTIVYNRPGAAHITMDNSDIYDLNELPWIRSHYPDVILMEDLYLENKPSAKNFNHFQLMVYANAEKFISIHGGTATLASYFGGTNLILSKKGPEHYFRCFEKLYPKLSGAHIVHAKDDAELKRNLEELFLM